MTIPDPEFDLIETPLKNVAGLDSVAATSALVWGIIAIFTWFVPVLGQVAGTVGLVRGIQGWQAANRDRARVGLVLSIISLVVALIVAFQFVAWIVYSFE